MSKPTLAALPAKTAPKSDWLDAIKQRRTLLRWALENKDATAKKEAKTALKEFIDKAPAFMQDLKDFAGDEIMELDLANWDELIANLKHNDTEYENILSQLK
ncbi:MAG: hypothetical protein WAX77_16595 [Methylococcaceae bacterium]